MKNKMQKSITLVLTLTMLVSVFNAYAVVGNAEQTTQTYPKFATEYGSVMVEAEKIVLDESAFLTEAVKDASNRKHIRSARSGTTQPAESDLATLGFELTFDQAGKYSIWARYIVTGNGEDSIWLDYGTVQTLSGEKSGYNMVEFIPYSPDATTYVWKIIATMPAVEAGESKTIRMRNREAKLVLDKFVITRHVGFVPEGIGKLPEPETIGKPAKLPENLYPIPTITPPPEHPRVLFRAKDIPQIKENMKHPENAGLVAVFNELKDKKYTGDLAAVDPNYNAEGLETILAKAFDYAIYGNETHGKEAVSAIKNYASSLQANSIGDNTRNKGHVIRVVGQVYDWCYPLLSDKDKEEMLMLCQSISSTMEVSFPPDAQTIICGHGAEWQLYRDWFTIAIACYDEFPDVYNMVGGKIFSPESVEYRNWWNQSGTHSQGTSYGPAIRYAAELYAHTLVKRMCGKELFNEEDLTKITYEWIYRRRPDGMIMIDGDDTSPNSISKGRFSGAFRNAAFLSSALSRDPIVKKELYYQGGLVAEYGLNLTPIDMLIINDPSIDTNASTASLPLTRYYSSPVGEMSARTGWNIGINSNDVVATMTISEYNPMNHGHYDAGHFMIYYKGILANDSGWYEMYGSDHHENYSSQSVAHNTLVIETDYNKWGNQNQGIDGPKKTDVNTSEGKNFNWTSSTWEGYKNNEQNNWAQVMAHEFGPDTQYPEYSYIAGDLTNAYTSEYDNGVNEALRHMIFLPTGDEKNPAAFVVFDKIDTKAAGKKKAFLLHMEQEPQISGNVTTIKRTENGYNGKLVNQTLLPAVDNLKIEKIGGVQFDADGKVIAETDKRFWNKEQNWFLMQDCGKAVGSNAHRTVNKNGSLEAGWGRVEIMPAKSGNVDYMLNVMYVGDADENSAIKKATLIENDSVAGAKIFDRVAVFGKSKQRIKDSVQFTIPGSEEALKVNVAGLLAGTWSINANGADVGTQIASEDGGIIYFTSPAGSVTLTYVSGDANKTFTKSEPPVVEGVTLYVDKEFIYSDVPPTIRDGRTLIPMRALLETMDATVTWDEASATATATSKNGVVIKITENNKTAYVDGEPIELDVPAMIINGRFVIPVRFIAEMFGCKVVWNERAQRVEITSPVTQDGLGIANTIGILEAIQSGSEPEENKTIASSYDGNFGTYWGVSSADGADVWGIYDFGRIRAVDKVMFSFMSGNARKYKFDIEISEDGVNYTPVLTGMETSGTKPVGEFDEFDMGGARARYVKYKGYGNTVNMWNSMVEIVFTEKK